jgi:ribosomal protein S21
MVGRQGKRNNQKESIDREVLEREYYSYSECLRWKKMPRHQHGL